MLVDTLLAFFVIRYAWRYALWLCLFATGFFLAIDGAFFSATLLKINDGGWFPLAIAAAVFVAMTTWRRGRERLLAHLRDSSVPLRPFLKSLFADPPRRVPGTAVFLTATPDATLARAAAQPEALPRPPRARRVPHGGEARRAVGAVRGAGALRAPRHGACAFATAS